MRLQGRTQVPGDKSISHRALIISAISRGKSRLGGLNQGRDVATTLSCLTQLGVKIRQAGNCLIVEGRDLVLQQPKEVLRCGNSGTTLRLLAGLLAGQNFLSILDGDTSLRRRPMARIVAPLRQMGADLYGPGGSNLAPLSIRGGQLQGITYELPMASAQVKSALLLGGLQASGTTTVLEPVVCRDHTEHMLTNFGAKITKFPGKIEITGGQNLEGQAYQVPGDFSSAAFLLGAGVILPNSEILIENVGLNPTRLGFFAVLEKMGAQVEVVEQNTYAGEAYGTILAKGSKLRGVTIGGDLIPRILDEIPILAVVATQAEGTTIIQDAEELRVKESDRLSSIAKELTKLGAEIRENPAGLEITGPTILRGATVDSHGDHRLALALEVASLLAHGKVEIVGREYGEISFPNFSKTLNTLIKE